MSNDSTFDVEDFEHTGDLLRSGNEQVVRATLSNNLNIILAALDRCVAAERARGLEEYIRATRLGGAPQDSSNPDDGRPYRSGSSAAGD